MKAALISPTPFLEHIQPFSDYHLILTHKVIYDRAYCDFYAKRSKAGDFIILDNSAVERNARSMPMKNIVLAAVLTKPTVIVMPDYLFDSKRTLKEIENAFRAPSFRFLKRVLPQVQLCAVVQGVDADDWMECFYVLNSRKNGIDILGIPMITSELFGSRCAVLDKIARRITKPVHLFGFWHKQPLGDVLREKAYNFVLGIDTSKPVKLAMQGKTLREWAKVDRDKGFMDRSHNSVNLELLQANCRGFIELCKVQEGGSDELHTL